MNKSPWTGRIITAIVVLFLIFDGVTKVMNVAAVREAMARLGYPESAAVWIGLVLLACTVLYVIPRTAILGAVVLTGYLGGAVATQVRAGASLFEISFPIIFGVLVWAGLFFRDDRVRMIIPKLN